MKSLENLAFFVRSCPIIIETSDKVKPPAMGLGRNYVYVADFDNGEPDVNVVRKALWYISRKSRYHSIGINDSVLTEEDKLKLGTIVLSRERPRPFKGYPYKKGFMFPLRVVPQNPVYLHPLEDVFIQRRKLMSHTVKYSGYDPSLKNLVEKWLEGETPQELAELFSDPLEDTQKLCRMLGSQTYQIAQNQTISPEIKALANPIRKEKRKQREKGIPVEALEKAVRLLVGDLDWTTYSNPHRVYYDRCPIGQGLGGYWVTKFDSNPGPPEEEIIRAIKAIAQTAYDIRQGYPDKGWEVRHGLVHPQSYRKLKRLASEKATPEIVSEIIQTHIDGTWMKVPREREDWPGYESYFGDFRQAMFYSGASRTAIEYPSYEKEYEEIGRLRVAELLVGKQPFTREMRVLTKIMKNFVVRQRFHNEVNNWLQRQKGERVDWLEIKRDLEKD